MIQSGQHNHVLIIDAKDEYGADIQCVGYGSSKIDAKKDGYIKLWPKIAKDKSYREKIFKKFCNPAAYLKNPSTKLMFYSNINNNDDSYYKSSKTNIFYHAQQNQFNPPSINYKMNQNAQFICTVQYLGKTEIHEHHRKKDAERLCFDALWNFFKNA